jgi:putative flippase GtrA
MSKKNSFASIKDKVLSNDTGHFVQFIKYGIAGGMATVTNIILFQLAAWLIWPCLEKSSLFVKLFNLSVPMLSDGMRARHAIYSNILAFMVANFVAYILNIKFVFKAGRHHWAVEIGLFYAVSGISMVLGTIIMGWLISSYGIPTDIAFFANMVTAILINYAVRKFFIFKG